MTAFPTIETPNKGNQLLHNLAHSLKRPGHRLQPFIRLKEDLFLDQIDLQLLVAELESRHGHFLTEEEASHIETIGDLQRLFN